MPDLARESPEHPPIAPDAAPSRVARGGGIFVGMNEPKRTSEGASEGGSEGGTKGAVAAEIGRPFDVLVVGGGPAGLQAALVLARARKRVALCDATPARNARAEHVNGFVTRDGTPPAELRRLGRAELARYGVDVRLEGAGRVTAIRGASGGFEVEAGGATLRAANVLLATGMIDAPVPWEGAAALWGTSVFQCPFCHAYELGVDAPLGLVIESDAMAEHAGLFLGWSKDLVVFTDGRFAPSDATRARYAALGIALETRAVAALEGEGGALAAVRLADGARIARRALFVRPPQAQVPVVTTFAAATGLALDGQGYVVVDAHGQTSVPGVFAAGDLATMMQSAILGAAAGARAAYAIVRELSLADTARRLAAAGIGGHAA